MNEEKILMRIQRFQKGHPFFTDAIIMHLGKPYQSVFGQCVDSEGVFMHYTLERKDTLIDCGVATFDYYNSPANHATVPRLLTLNGVNIMQRLIENHIANFAYELAGCTAHGKNIDLKANMLTGSRTAFDEINTYLNGRTGIIIYENLEV